MQRQTAVTAYLKITQLLLFVFARIIGLISQQTQNICIAFVQRRPNVEDVGPTLYKMLYKFSVLAMFAGIAVC